MREKTIPFDAAELLETDQDIADFLDDMFATNDPACIAHGIGVAARAKSMMQVAQDTGLAREQLYRSFSEQGNPTLRSVVAVMNSLGLRLAAIQHQNTPGAINGV